MMNLPTSGCLPIVRARRRAMARIATPLLRVAILLGLTAGPVVAQYPASRAATAVPGANAVSPAATTSAEEPIPVDENGSPIDPVRVLQQKIESGEVTLEFDEEHGYLKSLLEHLGIPIESQNLVFSRTSLQTNLITPWTPRALYFNDDVYIGWVQDSPFIEVASIDPDDGGVFYTLNQEPEVAHFAQEGTTCLMCHESRTVTEGIPGVMVRSVLSDRFGYPIAPLHEGTTTDRTPFDQRFAGWYVTGKHGGVSHAGNVYSQGLSHEVTDVRRYLETFDMNAGGNVVHLEGRFDVEPYLTPHSDIVALLVLTHQTKVHNLITVAHVAAREAVGGQAMLTRINSGMLPVPPLQSAAEVRVNGAVDRMVQAMLFSREAPLPGPVEGTSGFQEEFESRGPYDPQGRSLREFDLQSRLFRYPMSFLIYSEAFEVLPDFVKEKFYTRLAAVLDGQDPTGDFTHLTEEDRTAIREILAATKPEFLEFIGAAAR